MKKSFAFTRPLAMVMMCWCLTAPTFAQGNLGGVTGNVSDSSGASVPGVAIKVISISTDKISEVTSGQSGGYTVQ
jgi:hypothetical protein